MSRAPAILFVCLGNICRSPLAEGALRAAAQAEGLDLVVDSAGTGAWHVGNPPDRRAIVTARARGIDISGLRARQIEHADFARFTHILALDRQNLAELRRMAPADMSAQLSLLLDLVPGRAGQAVADPYHGDDHAFELTWRDVSEAAAALITHLRA